MLIILYNILVFLHMLVIVIMNVGSALCANQGIIS